MGIVVSLEGEEGGEESRGPFLQLRLNYQVPPNTHRDKQLCVGCRECGDRPLAGMGRRPGQS